MRTSRIWSAALLTLIFIIVGSSHALAQEGGGGVRPRIIATTDGEIDDRCSMVRFLLYNNEWDIEGIIHCSSKFHWKGDGHKIKRHGWADETWLDKQIDLYEKLYPNLIKHDKGFYTADQLRKLVYTGNVENVGEMTKVTAGSTRIVEVLLDNDPRPVYLQAWGGNNTIARALKTIKDEHPNEVDRVSKKAIMFIILDQDRTFRGYIAPSWPKMQVLGSFRQFECIAYNWHRIIPNPAKAYFEKPWMEQNILKGHGELCARYESSGGRFRSEGDSPSFMHQIDVGLRSLEYPAYGGWGGRFQREKPGSHVWRGAQDDGDLNKAIWRWAIAFQNDWAARADWGVTQKYEDANHPPEVKLASGKDVKAGPGEKVKVSVAGSTDPDGDELTYKWWQYKEAGSYKGIVDIHDANKQQASFVIPKNAGRGETVHIICEVTDSGKPALTRYQRFIVEVNHNAE